MQPCHVCGAMAVTTTGHCAGCGTYRGASYPASGLPISGPPISGAPPVSGPPPYPAGPPPRQRSPFMVPLIALSSVLILLVIAIVVVAAVHKGGGDNGNTLADSPTPAPPTTQTKPAIDDCLIGTWRATDDNEQINIPGYGAVRLNGRGVVAHIKPDGTLSQDYSQASAYTGSVQGQRLSIRVNGTISGRITTETGTISFHDMRADGTITATVNGAASTSAPLAPGTDPMHYSCSDTHMKETTATDTIEFTKVSPTP